MTSDDTGAAKEIVCGPGTDTSKKDTPQPTSVAQIFEEPKSSSASKIVYTSLLNNRYAICCRLDTSISVYDLQDEAKVLVCHQTFEELKGNKSVSLHLFTNLQAIVIGLNTGKVAIVRLQKGARVPNECQVVQLPEGKNIETLEACPHDDGVFAYGGKENDLRIVRIFKSGKKLTVLKSVEVLFAAKNVKNDHLDLRVPIWINKIRFLPLESSFKLVTATNYGQLRIYDTDHGKKPLHDYQIGTNPLITLNFVGSNHDEVVVSDNKNVVAKYSLTSIDKKAFKTNSATAGDIIKSVPKLLGKYQEGGNTGAIFGVESFKDEYLATGGLDRYLRVYDLGSRSIVAKVFVGCQVSDIIFLEGEEPESTVEEVNQEEENDALWEELESRPVKKQKI